MNNQDTAYSTTKTNTIKKPRLCFADGLRGIAALWVVFYHLSEGKHIEEIKHILPIVFYKVVFDWGHLGVAIFFVLSGFVMALTAHHVKFDFENACKFIVRRLVRLAPPYYCAIVISLFLIYVKSKALHIPYNPPSVESLFQHVFFIQGILNTPHINIVYWTLCIEVQFYIVFALLLWVSDHLENKYSIRHARAALIVLAASFAMLWPLGVIKTTLWQGGFIGFWYSFLIGVTVCWGWLNKGILLATALVLSLSCMVVGLISHDQFMVVVAISAGLMQLAGLKDKMDSWLNWAWLQWLGLISYSLYLLHNPVTGASARIVKKFYSGSVSADIVTVFVAMACCLIIAYLSFLIDERPSIKWSHQIKLKK